LFLKENVRLSISTGEFHKATKMRIIHKFFLDRGLMMHSLFDFVQHIERFSRK